MGKLLSKFEQLFTPDCLQPEHSASESRSRNLSSSSSASSSACSDNSKTSFRCRDLMGSIIDKLKSVSRKDNARNSDDDEPEGGARYNGRDNNKRLPFDALPEVCKLKIFSYLNNCQKSSASQVCEEWRSLLQSATLWTDVDLTLVPGLHDCSRQKRHHRCKSDCHETYITRVASFLNYLSKINPIVNRICFTYDIYTNHNRFVQSLSSFLSLSRCAELRHARLIWNSMSDTTSDDHHGVPTPEESDRLRCRQRLFVQFFQAFVAISPNIHSLELPFDWSPASVRSLLQLTRLKSLNLRHYFPYQSVDPGAVSRLLAGLRDLRTLNLEIWTASGSGLLGYSLCSKAVEELDLSRSRGLYVCEAHLPSLRVLRIRRTAWSGPLSSSPAAAAALLRGATCLYELLAASSPKLEWINDHRLRDDWRDDLYPQLDDVMKSVCACSVHYEAGPEGRGGVLDYLPGDDGSGNGRTHGNKCQDKSNAAGAIPGATPGGMLGATYDNGACGGARSTV